jgi:hypothetical protein
MKIISLEDAWDLLESLNHDANQKTRDLWNSVNHQEAILQQSAFFRNSFLNLDKDKQQAICYWINDDEFRDYFKCLSGDDFITSL